MGNTKNEKLSGYYNSLTGFDQKIFYATEVHNRKNLQMKTLDDEKLYKLATSKRGKKFLIGEFNYNMLTN